MVSPACCRDVLLFDWVERGFNSLINNANLISKVYFPRLIVPTATVIVAFVDFWSPSDPDPADGRLSVPTWLADAGSASLPCWRFWPAWDQRYGLPRSTSVSRFPLRYSVHRAVWAYVSPVGLAQCHPQKWRMLYSLNPMVGVIDGFRWCILRGQSPLYLPGLAASVCVAVFFLWLGIHRFRSMEKSFADLI
jgi:lipopolysaccharide transport system permease protein